ncbi:unnamed protein product, partial [Ixodes pacificus]
APQENAGRSSFIHGDVGGWRRQGFPIGALAIEYNRIIEPNRRRHGCQDRKRRRSGISQPASCAIRGTQEGEDPVPGLPVELDGGRGMFVHELLHGGDDSVGGRRLRQHRRLLRSHAARSSMAHLYRARVRQPGGSLRCRDRQESRRPPGGYHRHLYDVAVDHALLFCS